MNSYWRKWHTHGTENIKQLLNLPQRDLSVAEWPLSHQTMKNCSRLVFSPSPAPPSWKLNALENHVNYNWFSLLPLLDSSICYLSIKDTDFCAFHPFYRHGQRPAFSCPSPCQGLLFSLQVLDRFPFLLVSQVRHAILIWLQHGTLLKGWKPVTSYCTAQ